MRKNLIFSFLFLILFIEATLYTCGCHQNKPAKTSTQIKKITDSAKIKPKKLDTLIFKDPALSALVQETYKYFSIFDTISPVGNPYDITKFKLSKSELDELRSYNDGSDSTNMWEGYSLTGAFSNMISINLSTILGWKDIGDYNLNLLFKNHIDVAKSPDARLYCFFFDEKTGGTYRSQVSQIHYYSGSNEQPLKSDTVFNSDGYISIDTIHTSQGIKYVMMGSVVGCSTCNGDYIDVMHYEKGGFVNDFNYNVNTRSIANSDNDGRIIAYDAKRHRINVGYTTNDMTPSCNCGKDGAETIDGQEFDGNEENVGCTYVFNGHTFVLKKKKVTPVKALK